MAFILRPVTARCRAIVEALDSCCEPEAVAWLTSQRTSPAILETRRRAGTAGRFSVFATDPVDVFTLETGAGVALCRIREYVSAFPLLARSPCEIPFLGGWIGFVSYEAGIPERLVNPRAEPATRPLVRFALYDHALVFDHQEERWWAVAVEWDYASKQPLPAKKRLQTLRQRVEDAKILALPPVSSASPRRASLAFGRREYRAAVQRVRRYIEAGDIYQANLAQRFRVQSDQEPFDVYRRLRHENPATFAAFLGWDNHSIVSASPELFLQLRDGHVVTRPIKGTRPRTGMAVVDAGRREELARSEKDRAELNMIVDLLRNDLGRVCEFGSVVVKDQGAIEEHPTVYHRVATIEGKLSQGKNWSDLLEAAYPGGSIVGAPKIRAMQVIRELEPFARGPYCGAIGWIGLDGSMTLSVAIRTMLVHDGVVDAFAGGGIVHESDPVLEYDEILAKARGLLEAIGADAGVDRIAEPEDVVLS